MAVTVAPPWPPSAAPASELDSSASPSDDHAPFHGSTSPFPSWHTQDASTLASPPSGQHSTIVEIISGPGVAEQHPNVQTEWQSFISSVNSQHAITTTTQTTEPKAQEDTY